MVRRGLSVILICLASLQTAAPAGAQADRNPHLVALGLGAFDITDDDTAVEGRIEFRPGTRILDGVPGFHGIGPVVGLMANVDGGVYGYGGFFLDFRWGEHVLIWPGAAVGAYEDGNSVDLGGVVEFQTGLTVAYQSEDQSHVGFTFSHISNAGIYDRNPGENSLWLSYAIPLRSGF